MSDSTYFMNDLNGEINFKQISFSIDGGKTYNRITQAIADNCVITNKKLNGRVLLKSAVKDFEGEFRDGVLYIDGKPAKYLTPTGETKTVTLQDDRAIDFSDTENVETDIILSFNNLEDSTLPESEEQEAVFSYNGVSSFGKNLTKCDSMEAAMTAAIQGLSTFYTYTDKDLEHPMTMLIVGINSEYIDYNSTTKQGIDVDNEFVSVSNYIYNTLKISENNSDFVSYHIMNVIPAILSSTDKSQHFFGILVDHVFTSNTIVIALELLSYKYSSIDNIYLTITDLNGDKTILKNVGYHLTSDVENEYNLQVTIGQEGEIIPLPSCTISNTDNIAINNSQEEENEKYVICNNNFTTREVDILNYNNSTDKEYYVFRKLRGCTVVEDANLGSLNAVFVCPTTFGYSFPEKLSPNQYTISDTAIYSINPLSDAKNQTPVVFHYGYGNDNTNCEISLRNSEIKENNSVFNKSSLILYLNYNFYFYDENEDLLDSAIMMDMVLKNRTYNDTNNLPQWNVWRWGLSSQTLSYTAEDNKYKFTSSKGLYENKPVYICIVKDKAIIDEFPKSSQNYYRKTYVTDSNVINVYPTEEDAQNDTNALTYTVTSGMIVLSGLEVYPDSVWVKYNGQEYVDKYEFIKKESGVEDSYYVDIPDEVIENDSVDIYDSCLVKKVVAELARLTIAASSQMNVNDVFVYDSGNNNYILLSEIENINSLTITGYRTGFGGFILKNLDLTLTKDGNNYILQNNSDSSISLHSIIIDGTYPDGKELIFRNKKVLDSSFASLTKNYPCIPFASNRNYNSINYEVWTKYCSTYGYPIILDDQSVNKDFVWTEYKKTRTDKVFKCVPLKSKNVNDVYSITFDFRNAEMPSFEYEEIEGQSSEEIEGQSNEEVAGNEEEPVTFKIKDLKNMLGTVVIINNNTPELSNDTYQRFINMYSVDQWNEFNDLIHSYTYIDFNTIILKMMTQSEDFYGHVILNMTSDTEQFYTRDMVNDSSHSDAIEISDDNTAKFLNIALEYRFDPNEETPLPSSNVRFISDNYRVSNDYDDSDMGNIIYNTTAQARTVVEIDRTDYDAFCAEYGHSYSAKLEFYLDDRKPLRNCFQANMILYNEFGNSMGIFSLQSDPEDWESPYTLTTLENVELDDTGSHLGLFGTIKTYINDEENTDDTYCPAPTSEEISNMQLDIPAHEEGWNPPVYNWYLMSEQIKSSYEWDKYILKFTVTDITDEELEAFLNSTLTINGAISETSPFDGGISLTDSNNTYMAFFDASGNNSLYPVKLECDLIKNGTIVGHMTYKMFNSDGETPAQTPQALGGSSRTFTSTLTKITE